MDFQLSSSHNNKVVLHRKKPGIIYIVALFSGVALLVTGVLFTLLFKPPQEQYFQGNAFFFIGILSFYSINSYLKKRKTLFPEEIIFDNNHGYLEITQDKSLESKSYIPYEEIECFSLRREKEKGRNSGSSYIISFHKKDGGIWDLIKSFKNDQAQSTLEKLKETVKLNQRSSPLPFSLSSKLEKEIQRKSSLLKWKNPVRKYLIPFTISAFLVLGFLLSFAGLAISDNAPFFAFVLIGLFMIVVLFSMSIQLKRFLKDSSTTYGISINEEALEYFEEHYSGKILKRQKIFLKELAGIVFSFQPGSTENFIQIKTIDVPDKEKTETATSRFLQTFGISKDKLFLNTKELNTVEKLQLENWIQENIRKYMGEVSL